MNENAFVSIVQTRPCLTFGRPVHRWDSSLDYGPVLLLKPFGFHLTMDTLSSGWLPGGERHKNSDRTRTTLWEYARPKASREHPTMKPVDLWLQAIQDGSRKGERVYDPFSGSGTTMIACEQTGRKALCMELSPQYCDVIVHRWEEFAGMKAERWEGEEKNKAA